MGCGMSMMDPKYVTIHRFSNQLRRNKIDRPVGDNSVSTKKHYNNPEQSLDSLPKQNSKCVFSKGNKDVCVNKKSQGAHEKQEAEKVVNYGERKEGWDKGGNGDYQNNEESEDEEADDREDNIFMGNGSPSFRDYCIDKSKLPTPGKKKGRGDPSFSDFFNDLDSGESNKNEGEHDSTKAMNKPIKEESMDSHKEPDKKERRGRGLWSVINKTRTGRKKTSLNSSYDDSHASSTGSSVQKMVGKAA